eukprot:6175644-Pleurochrysis_carterae.AAC.1
MQKCEPKTNRRIACAPPQGRCGSCAHSEGRQVNGGQEPVRVIREASYTSVCRLPERIVGKL